MQIWMPELASFRAKHGCRDLHIFSGKFPALSDTRLWKRIDKYHVCFKGAAETHIFSSAKLKKRKRIGYQFVLVFQHVYDVAWCIFLAVHWTAFAILAMFQSIGWRQSLLPAEFSSLLDLVLAIYSFGFLKFVGGVLFEIVFALHNVGVFYQFTMTPNCLYVNYDH